MIDPYRRGNVTGAAVIFGATGGVMEAQILQPCWTRLKTERQTITS
ncbi:MAG: hypothetical protein QM368_06375 [Bacillota bacterium]|nr:hypothetical protein [Bacillota bacterium]